VAISLVLGCNSFLNFIFACFIRFIPSLLWHCWLGYVKVVQSVKHLPSAIPSGSSLLVTCPNLDWCPVNRPVKEQIIAHSIGLHLFFSYSSLGALVVTHAMLWCLTSQRCIIITDVFVKVCAVWLLGFWQSVRPNKYHCLISYLLLHFGSCYALVL